MVQIYFTYARLHQNDVRDADMALVQKLKQRFDGEWVDEVSPSLAYNDVSNDAIQQIKEAVSQASVVLFVFSAEAYADYHRYIELSYALEQGIQIIPVCFTASKVRSIEKYINEDVWGMTLKEAKEKIDDLKNRINRFNWVRFDKYRLTKLVHEAPNYVKQNETLDEDFDYYEALDPDAVYQQQVNRLSSAIYSEIQTWHAFLSYARRDKEYVLPLKDAVESLERELWFDNDDIPAGQDFLQEIFRGVEKSHNYICVVSNGWLASVNCYEEYQYAKTLNKRIIPIIYEEFDKQTCLDILTNERGGWRGFPPDEAVEEYSAKVWEELSELQKIATGDNQHKATAEEIVNRFSEEVDYINQHTKYLIKAKDRELNNGDYLNFFEWYGANNWYRANKNREIAAPNTVHQQYFQNSLTNFLTRVTVLSAIIFSVIGVIAFLYILNIQTRAQAAEDLAAETEERLQVLAQVNNAEVFDISGEPSTPLFADGSVWVTTSDNTIERVQANSLLTETYPAGIDPGQAVYASGFIWVNNQGSASVTRIDPAAGSVEQIDTERSPQTPLVVGEHVWIHSMLSGRLQRLTGEGVNVRIGLNTSSPIASDNYLWYLDSNRSSLYRVNQDGVIDTLELGTFAQQIIYHDRTQRVVVITQEQILTIIPDTLQIAQSGSVSGTVTSAYQDAMYVWVMLTDGTGVIRYDVLSGAVQTITTDNITRLAVLDGQVWVMTADSIQLLNPETMSFVGEPQVLLDTQDLLAPQSDGIYTWFPYPQRDTVYLLSQETGMIERELSICENALPPLFDGTRMWFSCREAQQLISIPAQMYFFGERSTLSPTGSYPPYLIGDVAWFVQRGTGRIHAYDMQAQRHLMTYDAGSVVLPLIFDAPYFWTAVEDTGELIRIDASQVISGEDVPDTTEFIRTQSYGRPASQVHVHGDYIWLQTLFDSPDDILLTIIDKSTLAERATSTDGDLVGATLYHNGDVWLTSFDITQGFYSRVDPATGTIIEQFTFDDTTYASMVPVLHEGLLWFTATLPNTADIMFVMMDIDTEGSNDDLPFYLVGVDPVTGNQVVSHRLPIWADIPRFSGDYAWFDVVAAPTIANEAVIEYANTGFLVINYHTGEVIDTPGFCTNHADAYVVNNLGWLGCWEGEQSFTVYDADSPETTITYDAVGEYPDEPLRYGDQLIFTFRHTGTIGIFDVLTGEWLYNYQVGGLPAGSFIYDDAIWVYSATSDTLQRIALQD